MKKRIFVSVFLAVLVLTSCGKKDKISDIQTETEVREETSDAEEKSEPEDIGQARSDALLEEKIKGLGCHAIFSERKKVDEVDCYLYSVVNNEGEEVDEMLAVNALSGEVVVYEKDSGSLLPFERFEYYADDETAPASWDGEYYLKPRTVALMPSDDSSFEFTITKDGEKEPEISGVAKVSGKNPREAVCEDGEISLSFRNRGDTLIISDTGNLSGVAGIYELIQ